MGASFSGPLHQHGERPARSIQLQVEGSRVRGSGQPASLSLLLGQRCQLVLPTLGAFGRVGREAAPQWSSRYGHRAPVAWQLMAPAARRAGGGGDHLSPQPRFVLSQQAQRARGSRLAALEHGGLQGALPSWTYLRPSQMLMRPELRPAPRYHPAAAICRNRPTKKYGILEGAPVAPRAASMRLPYLSLLGEDPLGQLGTEMMTSQLAESSYKTYGTGSVPFLPSVLHKVWIFWMPRLKLLLGT